MKSAVLFRSLLFRLLAGTALAICAALLAAGFVLNGIFAEQAGRQFESQLRQQLDHLTAHVEFDANGAPFIAGSVLSDPRWQLPYSGLYGQIDGVREPAVWRSRSLWDTTLENDHDGLPGDGLHVHAVNGPRQTRLLLLERRVRQSEVPQAEWRILVAADRGPLDAAIADFRGALGASLAVLALLLLLAAALQAFLLMRPLRALQGALADVHDGRSSRLHGDFPAEMHPLIEQFNGVLDRNEELIGRARHNAGNLAHALRTPLTILEQSARQVVQVSESAPGNRAAGKEAVGKEAVGKEAVGEEAVGFDAALAKQVLAQVATARRHVDWHLARARAEGAGGVPGQRTDTGPVVQGLLRVMARVHAARELQFRLAPVPADAHFAGEEQDLQEMVGNLLDNACKWARSAVSVSVSVGEQDASGGLHIRIEDDGPGIADDARARALARGGRLDESVSGSGLGLAIVADLARSYRGELRLERAESGGLRAELRLPLAR
ncbi:MAG: sensor histidine kinase [Gammaproteobacteria bacterium]